MFTSLTERSHCMPATVAASEHSWASAPPSWGVDEAGLSYARRVSVPSELAEAISNFSEHGADAGALVLGNLPVGDLPPTPASPTASSAKCRTSELTLLRVATALGEPVGYAPEHGGDLIQNIVPTKAAASRQVSTSSKVTLMFHTEAAFHPFSPRYLLLLCLRGDSSAQTTLASINQVRHLLDPATLEVLSQPRFRTAVDESYLHGSNNVLGEPMAVLSGDPARPRMIFDADLMVGMDPVADAALLALGSAIHNCHTGVTLTAGDLLIVDNHAAVHGRSPYTPRFDGTDRWLQRTFVVTDLAESAHDRVGRVITTRFGAPQTPAPEAH